MPLPARGSHFHSLEGIGIMATDSPSSLAGIAMLIVGVCAIGLGLFMVLPVAVNLPDSWFGAVLTIVLLGGGVALVYVSGRNLRASETK
jgi:hypothetical protein